MPRRTNDGVKKRCGCGPKRWPKCAHPWHFSFHHGGQEHRHSLDVVARARGVPPPTTKAEARTWRDQLRNEIRAGTFANPDAPLVASPVPLTFGDVADHYVKRFVRSGQHLRERTAEQAAHHLRIAREMEIPTGAGATMLVEHVPIAMMTKADIEAIRTARRPRGVIGTNRLLARLRHMFNWAIAEGYLTTTPFKRHGVTVVKLEMRAEVPRHRRLEPGEEDRLREHASPHLRALVVAALSTGCRLGELLSLQWSQIRRDDKGEAQWLVLPAAKTKTNETRIIPVGPRLRAELEMRRTAPDGKTHPTGAFVFGNEVGQRIRSIKTAWWMTCKRAGVTGLHFHDLRREFASRLLESSADLHDVQMFLGHAAITTTSRYLQSTPVRLAKALARLEGEDAGFAHDSHKSSDAQKQPADQPAGNRLN